MFGPDDTDAHDDPNLGPEQYDEPEYCRVCSGLLFPLGTLGNTDHYRCRSCGANTSYTRRSHMRKSVLKGEGLNFGSPWLIGTKFTPKGDTKKGGSK
jgi:hypothetical protein